MLNTHMNDVRGAVDAITPEIVGVYTSLFLSLCVYVCVCTYVCLCVTILHIVHTVLYTIYVYSIYIYMTN